MDDDSKFLLQFSSSPVNATSFKVKFFLRGASLLQSHDFLPNIL